MDDFESTVYVMQLYILSLTMKAKKLDSVIAWGIALKNKSQWHVNISLAQRSVRNFDMTYVYWFNIRGTNFGRLTPFLPFQGSTISGHFIRLAEATSSKREKYLRNIIWA